MRTKVLLLTLLTVMTATAQKLFTLEELNYGGKNYRQTLPENRNLLWWENTLVRADKETTYIVDLKTGKEQAMTAQQKEAFDGWQKKKTTKAEVRNHNIFVITADGSEKQITTDGNRELVYGEAVHRNEFGIMDGLFWSPDRQRLAFYRMDQSMVADYPQVNIDTRIAAYEPDKYPMAGETSHKVTVGVYDVQSGKTIYLKAGDPTDRYFTNIAWNPEGTIIYMFELNRDQNDCRLVSYNALTGDKIAELYRETSTKYVEPQHPIVFLPWDNSQFIMQSQKDGYNHLYLFSKDGKLIRQLTSGKWVVLDVLGFNKKQKSVIISSNEVSPIQQNLFAVNIKNGKRTPLDNGRGYHAGMLSDNGEWLFDKYQEPDVPRDITIVNTGKGKIVNYFSAPDPWKDYQVPLFECGKIKAADGVTDLYYRMVKPHDFDATKKYPTVVYVYGGPHAHNVDARWHYCSRSWETYMAQKGYVLFILDNRGSENRGRDFEQATFRQLGQIEMQDQMKGVDYLKSLPYVDSNRIGVHGWSFGGFMTITLMTNHPEVFKVGVAGGPVIDWKWYEVMYGERYMDTPQENPEGYANANIIPKIKNVKCPLLVMHGCQDHTVVWQHTLELMRQAVTDGVEIEYFPYTAYDHNVIGPERVHLWNKLLRFHNQNLKGE